MATRPRLDRRNASLTEATLKAQEDRFFEMVSNTCNMKHAAETVGLSYPQLFRWRNPDCSQYRKDFAERLEEALNIGAHSLEAEAIRRATEGITEEVYYQGVVVGEQQRYSDGLMTFLLKGQMNGKYGDKQRTELTGPNGGPIQSNASVQFYIPANGRGDAPNPDEEPKP